MSRISCYTAQLLFSSSAIAFSPPYLRFGTTTPAERARSRLGVRRTIFYALRAQQRPTYTHSLAHARTHDLYLYLYPRPPSHTHSRKKEEEERISLPERVSLHPLLRVHMLLASSLLSLWLSLSRFRARQVLAIAFFPPRFLVLGSWFLVTSSASRSACASNFCFYFLSLVSACLCLALCLSLTLVVGFLW